MAAGVGFTGQATAADIVAAVEAALAGHDASRIDRLATAGRRAALPAFRAAAAMIGATPIVPDDRALAAAAAHAVTESRASRAATGLPSVAECAALAAAGPGARLLGPRLVRGKVTCALAAAEETRR